MACNIGICQLKTVVAPHKLFLKTVLLVSLQHMELRHSKKHSFSLILSHNKQKLLTEGQISIRAGSDEKRNADGSPKYSSTNGNYY